MCNNSNTTNDYNIMLIIFTIKLSVTTLPSRLWLKNTSTALLQRGIPPTHTHTNEYSGYDTKQSDGEVPVMLELWEMRSTPSLLSLHGPL